MKESKNRLHSPAIYAQITTFPNEKAIHNANHLPQMHDIEKQSVEKRQEQNWFCADPHRTRVFLRTTTFCSDSLLFNATQFSHAIS